MALNSLSDVLVEQLGLLYSAEQQLLVALPKLAGAAHSYDLRGVIETHLDETHGHVERLDAVFTEMGVRFTPSSTSHAMDGLIREADDVIATTGDSVAMDAALIAAAQRIEHYEIAGYATACDIARELGLDRARSLLHETLEEEAAAVKQLTKLAAGGLLSSGINHLAAVRTTEEHFEAEGEPARS